MLSSPPNRRILLVDDTPAIHQDFRKLLLHDAGAGNTAAAELDDLEAALFGTTIATPDGGFELDSAYQGQEALAMVRESLAATHPYAMSFVDMRMPPGWDGAETIERMWQVDPRLQMVICTAYSDHSWDRVLARLDARDRLLILKKPFDSIEVCQLATTLTAKWNTARQAEVKLHGLERMVSERTAELRQANEALCRELAERKRTQAELTVAASVFHHALDGIMITDHVGRIISVNPAFTAVTGYQPHDVIGQLPSQIWGDTWNDETLNGELAQLAATCRWEGEVWVRRRSGERLLLRASISRVKEDEPSAERHVCLFHDITDLRRKDERIRHLAFHDHLTGLPNQALLIDRLNESIERARCDRGPSAFCSLTSIASNPSTTRTAMTSATYCSGKSPPACAAACAGPTRSPGSAVTNSSSCSDRPHSRRGTAESPKKSSTGCPNRRGSRTGTSRSGCRSASPTFRRTGPPPSN